MRKEQEALNEALMAVSYAVLPENGEDSFALGQDEQGSFLCVTDGCGGLGSRRYAALEGRTGAYIAARLTSQAFAGWAKERGNLPSRPEEGRQLCRELERDFARILMDFADRHCTEEKTRIVGSMQRRLPATLCAAITQTGAAGWREAAFLWAGDSRGYVLDEEGLHQCTQDHTKASLDAFESLYRDMPLERYLSADCMPQWSMRRLRAPLPCVIITATDGAYASLPTPMEFEMLLLVTLLSSNSWKSWEKKLHNQLKKLSQDDATLLLQPCGVEDIEELKSLLTARKTEMQKRFITPVRRRQGDAAYAREKWLEYRVQYDWTEGGRHERMDWRI